MPVLKKQVKIGGHYAIRHAGDPAHRLSIIRIERESPYGGWDATKLKTGRTIHIRSAAKLRYEVAKTAEGWRQV